MLNRISIVKYLLFIQITILVLAGCASYEAKKISSAPEAETAREVKVSSGSLEISAVAMFDKESANSYLGIDPGAKGMAPIFFRIRNNGAGPVKINTSSSYITAESTDKSPCLTIEEACNRARRGDAAEVIGWSLAFGVTGALASGANTAEVNRTLERDYYEKQFKPTLINAGGTGEGFLFFDVPKEKQATVRTAAISYLDLAASETREIKIDLR